MAKRRKRLLGAAVAGPVKTDHLGPSLVITKKIGGVNPFRNGSSPSRMTEMKTKITTIILGRGQCCVVHSQVPFNEQIY